MIAIGRYASLTRTNVLFLDIQVQSSGFTHMPPSLNLKPSLQLVFAKSSTQSTRDKHRPSSRICSNREWHKSSQLTRQSFFMIGIGVGWNQTEVTDVSVVFTTFSTKSNHKSKKNFSERGLYVYAARCKSHRRKNKECRYRLLIFYIVCPENGENFARFWCRKYKSRFSVLSFKK